VFPDSLAAAYAARAVGATVIWYGHSTMEDFRDSFKGSNQCAPTFRRWLRLYYGSGDAVITPTRYSKTLLDGYHIDKPIYVLSNGVDTDFFAPSAARRVSFRNLHGLHEGDKAVMSAGHYIERKGILDFIELAKTQPQTRFFWYGYTSHGIVSSKIRHTMAIAPPNVSFPGFVSSSELRDAYCGCDLFLFPSYEETEGIVVLEALASGIPVLVRDIPVYSGWLQDGANVYKARNNDDFMRIPQNILDGELPDLTAEKRGTARARNITETGRKLLRVYDRVMSDRSAKN
jgi:1,2-diacylglycerol-3-alpha-glucose alpha-1,2-glucosyltransferase